MLPLIVSGVFLAGLIVEKNFHKRSKPWNSREEEQHFHQDRARWTQDVWMLYKHLQ
jgi:hypothetical protein